MLRRWGELPQGARWLAGGLAAVVLALAVTWLLFVPAADWLAHHDVGSATGALHETALDNARDRLLTFGAGLFAAGALIFTARNFTVSRRTLELTEQGQVTDRYTKAIEQLGSDKLDVRIGGIYALERVARDSARDLPTVMEVLTAFIREHSHEPWPPPDSSGREPERSTRPDVQAAATVVGRRDAERDIRHIDLTGADLTRANLTGALLRDTDLTRAILFAADLTAADLTGADLTGGNLTGAHLTGAHLTGAWLAGARLTDARLTSAYLARANLAGARLAAADLTNADLTRANLTRADLTNAHLTGAWLADTFLADADLTGADLTRADLSDARLAKARLARATLDAALWTERTTWPDDIADRIRQGSDEIRPGIYRVRGGTEPDRSELAYA
jgi:uncharacterized protein YjbI with pentapeptide repeats